MVLGNDHAEGLQRGGWTPQRNLALAAALAAFDKHYNEFLKLRDARKQATRAFRGLIFECNQLRRKLMVALQISSRAARMRFKPGRELLLSRTRSASQISIWFETVKEHVEKHREVLAKLFPADPLLMIEALTERLNQGIGKQSATRHPVLAKRQQEAKVAVAELLVEQRLAAAIAFQHDKRILAAFGAPWDKKRRTRKTARALAEEAAAGTGAAPEPPKT